jgi:hypothetical protein
MFAYVSSAKPEDSDDRHRKKGKVAPFVMAGLDPATQGYWGKIEFVVLGGRGVARP